MDDEILPFDQTMQKLKLFFLCSGFNLKKDSSILSLAKSRILYIINFFFMNGDLVGALCWFIDAIRTGKDFLSITYIAPCIFISTAANAKGLFFLLNEAHVKILIETLRNMEKEEKKREYSKEREDIVNKERDFLNIAINFIILLYFLACLTFAMNPLILMLLKYQQNGYLEYNYLPFLVLYPFFDPYQAKVWPFAYLHQIWSEIVASLWFLTADLFFFTGCTYIRIQFKLLQHSIHKIIPEQQGVFRDSQEFKQNFKELIIWHQNLIDAIAVLEQIYSKSTLSNFVISSFQICLTGFNVTMVHDVTFIVCFSCFLALSLFQIFFLCFFADLAMVASMEVTDAVYKTQWYMAESSVGKKLLIMHSRAQTPCKLTAFGFTAVNLNSFMRVLSTAWSYFALLQTVYGN